MERRSFFQTVVGATAALFGLSRAQPQPPVFPVLEIAWENGVPRIIPHIDGRNYPATVHYGHSRHANGWYRIWATSEDGRFTASAYTKRNGPTLHGLQVEEV